MSGPRRTYTVTATVTVDTFDTSERASDRRPAWPYYSNMASRLGHPGYVTIDEIAADDKERAT